MVLPGRSEASCVVSAEGQHTATAVGAAVPAFGLMCLWLCLLLVVLWLGDEWLDGGGRGDERGRGRGERKAHGQVG